MHPLTYGIEPRMDGDAAQRLAWRVMALREGLTDVTSTGDGEAAQKIAGNALLVDNGNATVSVAV